MRPLSERKIGWIGKSTSLPSGNWAKWLDMVRGTARALSNSCRLNLRTKRSFWCHGAGPACRAPGAPSFLPGAICRGRLWLCSSIKTGEWRDERGRFTKVLLASVVLRRRPRNEDGGTDEGEK